MKKRFEFDVGHLIVTTIAVGTTWGLICGIHLKFIAEPKRIDMVLAQFPKKIAKEDIKGGQGAYLVETKKEGHYYRVYFDLEGLFDVGEIEEITEFTERKIAIKK